MSGASERCPSTAAETGLGTLNDWNVLQDIMSYDVIWILFLKGVYPQISWSDDSTLTLPQCSLVAILSDIPHGSIAPQIVRQVESVVDPVAVVEALAAKAPREAPGDASCRVMTCVSRQKNPTNLQMSMIDDDWLMIIEGCRILLIYINLL